MGQVIKLLASVSLSVCLSSLLRPQFLFDFMKFCTVVLGLKSKIEFVWSENPTTPSHILAQFFTPVLHFQWEGSNTIVRRPEDLYWWLIAQKTCLGAAVGANPKNIFNPSFARDPKIFEAPIVHISVTVQVATYTYGYNWPPIENRILRVKWSPDW